MEITCTGFAGSCSNSCNAFSPPHSCSNVFLSYPVPIYNNPGCAGVGNPRTQLTTFDSRRCRVISLRCSMATSLDQGRLNQVRTLIGTIKGWIGNVRAQTGFVSAWVIVVGAEICIYGLSLLSVIASEARFPNDIDIRGNLQGYISYKIRPPNTHYTIFSKQAYIRRSSQRRALSSHAEIDPVRETVKITNATKRGTVR